jgi:hypothetical protein
LPISFSETVTCFQPEEEGDVSSDGHVAGAMKIIRVVREKGSVPSAKLISAKGISMVTFRLISFSRFLFADFNFSVYYCNVVFSYLTLLKIDKIQKRRIFVPVSTFLHRSLNHQIASFSQICII